MTHLVSNINFKLTEQHVALFEQQADNWLKDYKEAKRCHDWELLIDGVNWCFRAISDLDNETQTAYASGEPFSDEMDAKTTELFTRWLAIAQTVQKGSQRIEALGYDVDGFQSMSANMAEVEAFLNPSDGLNDAMAHKCELAVRSYEDGRCIAGLED